MESYARMQLARDDSWRSLLEAYAEVQNAQPETPKEPVDPAAEANPRSVRWVPRLDEAEGVKPEHLPRLHGRLIAFGLLKFQLANASVGVEYRVTPQGFKMLEQGAVPMAEDEQLADAA